jgi:hypothetical protein
MKTNIFLSMLFFGSLAYFAEAEDNGNESKAAQNASAENTIPEKKAEPDKFKIDIYPTYGLYGSPRTTPFIACDSFAFSARLVRMQANKNEDFDCRVLHEVYDSDGNLVRELPEARFNSKIQFGRATAVENFWIQLEDPKPGKYRLKILIIDRANEKPESKDYPFEIVARDTFGVLTVGFTNTPEHFTTVGSNFTVGEPKALFCWINGANEKEDRIHLKSKLTILDSKKNPIDAEPLFVDMYKPALRNNRDYPAIFYMIRPDVPGDYILHLEINDCNSDKNVTCDVPIKVSLPPGMEE